jgi:hypothetical protein
MTERDERGWELEQSEFMNSARSGRRGVDVCVDNDTVQVDVEQGSGYMREHTTAYIPLDIMIRLLEHAGYTVAKK